MLFSSWLQNWIRSAPTVRRRTPASARPKVNFRPRLQAFECRCLPSGLPYPTTATVSQLIADINYADKTGGAFTINLKPKTTFDLKKADNTTNGANGLPVVGGTKAVDLTITGNGDTIERVGGFKTNKQGASNAFRLLDVAPGASLTLQAVTLQGGWAYGSGVAADGGAIYNQGTLTVGSGSTLSGNAARYFGGDIYNAGGTATVSNSTMSPNISGGGTYNNGGTLTVSYSTLSNGSIENHGGSLTVSYSTRAGVSGISNYGGTVTVSSSTLGGIGNSGGTVTVSNSTLGHTYNSAGSLTVSNCTLSGSAATYGGAICNDRGTVTVSNSTMSSNNASYGGDIYNAGTLTVSNCILSGSSATYGGGIYNAGGTVTVSNSTLSGNYATPDYSYRGGYGGGIYNSGGNILISASTLIANSARGGGGIDNDPQGTVTVQNASSITWNSSFDDSIEDVLNLGVLYLDSSSTIGILDGNPAILI